MPRLRLEKIPFRSYNQLINVLKWYSCTETRNSDILKKEMVDFFLVCVGSTAIRLVLIGR